MDNPERLGADVFDSSTPTGTHLLDLLGDVIGQTPLVESFFLMATCPD